MSAPRAQLEAMLRARDLAALRSAVGARPLRVLGWIAAQLARGDDPAAQRAHVELLGALVEDAALVPEDKLRELLRRWLWALNDESGAVPLGLPEAIGEALHRRPGLQPTYLPLLCAFLSAEEMLQTGPIERGVMWALGRVGPAAARTCPQVTALLGAAARGHPDPETRAVARAALARVDGEAQDG